MAPALLQLAVCRTKRTTAVPTGESRAAFLLVPIALMPPEPTREGGAMVSPHLLWMLWMTKGNVLWIGQLLPTNPVLTNWAM